MVTDEEIADKSGVSIIAIRRIKDAGFNITSPELLNGTVSRLYDSFYNIDKDLRELKRKEPNSDNLFFRLAIIGYEWGDLQRSIVYAERFNDSNTIFKVEEGKKVVFKGGFKDNPTILAEGKLAMADLLTQLFLLCESLGWKWHELRQLGTDHLRERHEDFKRDGWAEVK